MHWLIQSTMDTLVHVIASIMQQGKIHKNAFVSAAMTPH